MTERFASASDSIRALGAQARLKIRAAPIKDEFSAQPSAPSRVQALIRLLGVGLFAGLDQIEALLDLAEQR